MKSPMTQVQVRRFVFIIAVLFLIAFMIPIELRDLFDTALILYSVLFIFITLDLAFWTWWGFASREKPTDVFVIIWMLMFSIWIVVGFNIYARYVFVVNPKEYTLILYGDWWSYRVAPEMFVFMWITAWIVSKLFGSIPDFQNIEPYHRPKILIIEDDVEVAKIIRETLQPVCSFQINVVHTLEEVKQNFIAGKYSCITIDLNLDGSIDNGIELVKYLRENDPLVYIAVISGFIDHDKVATIMEYVDDILAKPFDLDHLQLKSLMWVLKYKRRMLNLQRTSSLDLR